MPSNTPRSSLEGPTDDVIDVVIPVYNNFSDARRLFAHLTAASNKSSCRLVIIDDASSESEELILPQASGHIVDVVSIRNGSNLGFAASVNKAMRLGRRDVVLLNTDTLVFDGWLDRLRAASRTHSRAATVTPLSNAATILSYPTFPDEFKAKLEISWQELDRACARFAMKPITIPTGVGFCMLITRACIDAIGLFDDITFRNGYGEECDFCRRAASAGWTNLAALDVFVWHRGEGSFTSRATELRNHAQVALQRRHPDYPSLVGAFIKNDPLRAIRRALDVARITADPRPCRLHLRMGPPGRPDSARKEMFFVREGTFPPRYRIALNGFAALPNLPSFSFMPSTQAVRQFLSDARTAEVSIHPRHGLSAFLFRRFERLARHLGLKTSRYLGPN